MKVFIAVDMEGIAGLVQWDNDQRDLQKRLMTEEVNAAARGAVSTSRLPILSASNTRKRDKLTSVVASISTKVRPIAATIQPPACQFTSGIKGGMICTIWSVNR